MQPANTVKCPMNIKSYLDDIYVDDPNRIFLSLSYMGEKITNLVAKADHNAHAKSAADHDYVTLEVPDYERGRIFSPVAGRLVSPRKAFPAGMPHPTLGCSVCIEPSHGMLYAPVTGRIIAQLPAHNAIGIMTFDGIQILVSVGRQPQSYAGTAFRQLAWQNDTVHLGDPLVAWDRAQLRREGIDDLVTMVVTNPNEFGPITTAQAYGRWTRGVREGSEVMRVVMDR